MAKAKKLPSGSWRCLVYDCKDDSGKRIYKSFTSDDPSPKGKREVELIAAQYAAEKDLRRSMRDRMTLGQAWDKYIADRANILSPATIREYKATRKNSFNKLMDVDVFSITQDDIQSEINNMAKGSAPKTVRNKHGLLHSVIKSVRPDFAIHTTLPQKIKPEIYVPTDEQVLSILSGTEADPDMHIAVMLAAFGPLRRSEICALRSDCINSEGVAHVKQAMVLSEGNKWVIKHPKTYAGDRLIPLPDFVYDEIKDIEGNIVHLNPNQITGRFETILRDCDLPHFRFHALRHYCASRLHSIGIPDSYIMERGGWENASVLDNIYRHALSDQSVDMNARANAVFSSLCNTKCNTNKKKSCIYRTF